MLLVEAILALLELGNDSLKSHELCQVLRQVVAILLIDKLDVAREEDLAEAIGAHRRNISSRMHCWPSRN